MTAAYRVRGLARPAEIVVDTWGIPHIYAETAADAFVAQGFNAARDRLFQIDLWRRRGLGQLSEVFGPAYVDNDLAARLFLYRGDLEREWAAYAPETEAIVTSFVTGVNAYVDWLDDNPDALPPEFAMLDYRPAHWEPADVVRIRSHGVAYNLLQEAARAATTATSGWKADLIRRGLQPPRQPHLADGIDLEIPLDVLRLFELATQPTVFAGDPRPLIGAGELPTPASDGSNNWAVAGSRTVSGRPILASDPHRTYATPSLRYTAHLVAPGLDVIGAGEPALPGVTLGHNGNIAFGFTIFPVDSQDLYVYELDPSDGRRYRYGDGWETMRIESEFVAVRGESARQLDLAFTRHGPVIYVDDVRHRAYAVRTTWTEPGTAAYVGSLSLLRARNGAEFRTGLRHWGSPGENHVYADAAGEIGWKAAGLTPRRVGWDGLLPVPGDGRYEWDGYYTPDEFPEIVDPGEGFIATANQFNLPDGFPSDREFSFEWADPARHRRIVESLAADTRHSMAHSMRLQNDQLSVAARDLIGVLDTLRSDDAVTLSALAMLRGWDAVESRGSAAAALYETWMSRHLMPAFARAVQLSHAPQVVDPIDPYVLRTTLLDARLWCAASGDDGVAGRDRLLVSTLRAAYVEVERLLGKDPGRWSWGSLHTNQQRHPLGFLDPSLDVGPIPVGGSGTTVNVAPYLGTDFVQTIGPSYRMVVDVGNWDNSVAVNTPGQSGDPRSPHYRDLVDAWRTGAYAPLLYSRQAIEDHAQTRIKLLPD
ncbi:MAG TPA: penicillin acylase family protein [Actinopolymorphaceae bacterium]|nr:penicillin acylase family protein [Actinopolymorphaceae bacterium]